MPPRDSKYCPMRRVSVDFFLMSSLYDYMRWWLRCSIVCGCGLLVSSATADSMTIGSQVVNGSLEGFERSQFLFRAEEGRVLRQSRASVRQVTLDVPRPARFLRKGRGNVEQVDVLGYADSSFRIRRDGNEEKVLGMHVALITMQPAPTGGFTATDQPTPHQRISLSVLERRSDLTGPQRSAIARYRSVRGRYDTFVSQSSALVAQMDAATGQRRLQLLNQLRQRKDQEQPLKQSLMAAEASLRAAFPQGLSEASAPGRDQAGANDATGSVSGPTTDGVPLPDVGENRVVLIDVRALKSLADLSGPQRAAIHGYEKARAVYEGGGFVGDIPVAAARRSDEAAGGVSGPDVRAGTLIQSAGK